MKNLFLLPTDKPSRLHTDLREFFLTPKYQIGKEINSIVESRNIYITSDEEIKDVRPNKGKWHLEKGNVLNKFPDYLTDLSECKLVIMTTDPQLIADGVQGIDDDFLEWFVKNPSCEEVEVVSAKTIPALQLTGNGHCWWKIIIQKEEVKQETIEEVANKANGYNVYAKETKAPIFNEGFIAGAKWQQKQDKNKYSEEDLKDAFQSGFTNGFDFNSVTFEDWFKQFKNK